nr:G1 family glutamic endopeptidase [Ktedonobacteraceae bacterium]
MWGGYGAYAPDGSQLYSYVRGAWTVPAVKQCAPGETSDSSAWVGLGGRGPLKKDPLEQIGTDSGCENGKPVYKAWYEMFPEPAQYFVVIQPGDSIDATVEYIGNSQYTLSLLINSKVYSFTQAGKNSIVALNAAECIQEDPVTGDTIDLLADFGSITFDHCYLVQTSLSGIQTELSIDSGPALVTYILGSSNGYPLETVGAVNSTTSNSSFTVTWNASI